MLIFSESENRSDRDQCSLNCLDGLSEVEVPQNDYLKANSSFNYLISSFNCQSRHDSPTYMLKNI